MIAEQINPIHIPNKEAVTNPPNKSSSRKARFWNAFVRWLKGPDMTLEQWEKLEKTYSPHSSHHAQIYLRERGF